MSVLKLKSGKLEVKSKSKGRSELIIFGEIISTKWDESQKSQTVPQDVKDLLDEIGDDDLDIFINSVGGNFFAGIAIYNMLKRHKGHKRVFVEGCAASISSVIAMVGDEIIIPENAYLMIHKSWAFVVGNADSLREKAAQFDRFDTTMAQAYLDKAAEGVTEEEIIELMKAETWLQGVEAQKYFNVTLEQASDVAASLDGDLYKNYNLPKEFVINNFQPKARQNKAIMQTSNNEIEDIKAKMRLELSLEEE